MIVPGTGSALHCGELVLLHQVHGSVISATFPPLRALRCDHQEDDADERCRANQQR